MATTYIQTSAGIARDAAEHRKLSAGLWVAQAVLAVLFVMTGSMKVFSPADMLAAQTPLPIALVRFIGLCEIAGALGLLLPGLLRVQMVLTAIAAGCLAMLMLCATVLTPILMGPDAAMMLLPFSVGLIAAFVAYARARVAPLRSR